MKVYEIKISTLSFHRAELIMKGLSYMKRDPNGMLAKAENNSTMEPASHKTMDSPCLDV